MGCEKVILNSWLTKVLTTVQLTCSPFELLLQPSEHDSTNMVLAIEPEPLLPEEQPATRIASPRLGRTARVRFMAFLSG